MASEKEYKAIEAVIKDRFGGTEGFMLYTLVMSAIAEQPVDIMTYSGKRFLEVTIDPSFFYPFMYGAGKKRMSEVMGAIKVQDRQGCKSTVSFNDIWIIQPMPKEGFSKEVLEAVDLSDGDQVDPYTGESLWEMIRKSYHCKDEAEVDYFLKRFIAS